MFRIAICDDQPLELETVAAYTKEYLERNQIDAVVHAFSHPDALLFSCEKERFQLYILDIVMPMVNGITVGREIRRFDREAQIIYATSEPGFALDAYAANPVNYLLKPIDKDLFFDTLAFAVTRLDLANEAALTVKTKDGLRVITLFSIAFCEYTERAARYTLVGGETITTRTLQESFAMHIAPLLRNKHFLQPHNAFVVNLARVEGFSKHSFTMRGGMAVPISTKQYAAVRDTYMDYLLTKEGEHGRDFS